MGEHYVTTRHEATVLLPRLVAETVRVKFPDFNIDVDTVVNSLPPFNAVKYICTRAVR